jgi:hypothetical protein
MSTRSVFMNIRKAINIELKDAASGEYAFLMIRVVGSLVGLLLTTRHSGDVEVYLTPTELIRLLDRLESAARLAAKVGVETSPDSLAIRSQLPGSTVQQVVMVNTKRGVVTLCLSREGIEDELREVEVALDANACVRLAVALEEARSIVETP